MGSIRRKPSGRWEARYRDARGAMHARSFHTKGEATRWVKDMEVDIRRGEWIDPRLGRITFSEWTDAYLGTIVHLRNVTRSDYERILRVHLLPAFADHPVAYLEPVDIRRFFAAKQAEGQAPKSLQKIRLVLRQVLETARTSGAIKANPCDGLKLPRAHQKEPVFLSADQVEVLAQATRPPYDVLVRFAAATGLRPSELCGLRIGRLNLMKGTVEVAEALTVVKGRTEFGPIKNGVRRTVNGPRSVCEDLAQYLAQRARKLGRAPGPDE
jgi:integrase